MTGSPIGSPPWAGPTVSVDVLAIQRFQGELLFATHERQGPPFAGERSLPGVLLRQGERLHEAARRALDQKLGIAVRSEMRQFGAFDDVGRDPRGDSVSVCYLAVLPGSADGDPAKGVEWTRADYDEHQGGYPGLDALGLAFDHGALAFEGLVAASERLWLDRPFTRALLADPFSTREALRLNEALGAQLPDRASNMSRWLQSAGAAKIGSEGRSALWEWSDHA